MPQKSYFFAVARLRALETKLLDHDRIARMIDTPPDEAFRILVEAGYGGRADASAADFEQLIETELEAAHTVFWEVAPDELAASLYLMKIDTHNLKLLLKARHLGLSAVRLAKGGRYSAEALQKAVKESDYRELPEEFQKELAELEKSWYTSVDPQALSIAMDRAYIRHALQKLGKSGKNELMRRYFKGLSDFVNVLTLLRARRMELSPDQLKALLIPPGDLALRVLAEAYDQPPETLQKTLSMGSAGEEIRLGLDEWVKSGKLFELEKRMDDYMLHLVKKDRHRIAGLAPILGYILAREQEARCVRLVFAAKRNKIDESVIKERLRELYG